MRLFKYFLLKVFILFVLVLFIFLPSLNLVVWQTDESLLTVKNNLLTYQKKSEILKKYLSSQDIVVTYPQADKFIFPVTPRVITTLVVMYDYVSLSNLVKLRQVYYYTFAPPEAVEYTSHRDFEPFGMQITQGEKIFQDDWLYQVVIYQPVEEEEEE